MLTPRQHFLSLSSFDDADLATVIFLSLSIQHFLPVISRAMNFEEEEEDGFGNPKQFWNVKDRRVLQEARLAVDLQFPEDIVSLYTFAKQVHIHLMAHHPTFPRSLKAVYARKGLRTEEVVEDMTEEVQRKNMRINILRANLQDVSEEREAMKRDLEERLARADRKKERELDEIRKSYMQKVGLTHAAWLTITDKANSRSLPEEK